jgi:phenylacetate-CoA ligase
MPHISLNSSSRPNPTESVDFIHKQKSDFWKKEQERKLIRLFQWCAKNVPAYRDFLKKKRIDSKKISTIKTYENFKAIVPSIGKGNYLRAYPWEDLCAPSALERQPLVLTSTSGSTGLPFYFPRNGSIDMHSSVYHEMFLRNSGIIAGAGGEKNGQKKDGQSGQSTLIIVCFGMGVWIGGVITYQAFRHIADRGYSLTIITPGVNKKEIYEALKNVGPKYDKIILCAYPPFMKDIVDEAKENGVDWKALDIRMVFAAESFSEKFRDYIMKKTGMTDPCCHTASVYGSADLGTMAMETPIAILIRRLVLQETPTAKRLYKKLFGGAGRLPTLAQYIPSFVNFETMEKNVYLSGDNAMPLVRYEIGDNGGTHYFSDVEKMFAEEGIDLRAEARKAGIADTVAELPFVYIYERTDLSTKLYGAIIYPEYIKHGLQHDGLEDYITGKFVMSTEHDKQQNEYLEINIELKKGVTVSDELREKVAERIHAALIKHSAEHANNFNMLKEKVIPRTVFWPHEHPTHFSLGTKQKWVKKATLCDRAAVKGVRKDA